MKYLFLLIISILLFANCSSTETVTEDQEIEVEEEVIEDRFAPSWYDTQTKSATDSISFSGYSYAIAEGEERAREQSQRLAISNLRFEIDRFAESVRAELEEDNGSDPFGSQQLIMNLRNAVQYLDLSDTDLDYDIQQEEGFHHVFTKAEISRADVVDMLKEVISNPTLSEAIENR